MPTSSIGPITITSEIVWNGKLAFVATDAQGFPNVYVSDGTAAGTVKVAGPFMTWGDHVGNLMAIGSNLLFTEGNYLWLSHGAAGDAVNATDPALFNNPSQSVFWPTVYNGQVWFEDYTQAHGTGTYSTDGVNVYYQGDVIFQGQPVQLNGKLIFPASTSTGSGLYIADSTQVTQLSTVQAATSPVVSGSLAYFLVQSGNDWQLWISNGTSAGTKQVSVVGHNAGLAPPPALTAVSGGVVFSSDDGVHGVQPWFSNGTSAGTHILDINTQPDPSASIPNNALFGMNGQAYDVTFSTTSQLWLLNGTAQSITSVGTGALDFIATDGSKAFLSNGGSVIWVTDGTAAGTHQIATTLAPTAYGSTVVDGKLYAATSSGLYATDGLSAPTLVYSGNAGYRSIGVGDNVFFSPNGAGLSAYNAVTHTTTSLSSSSVNSSAVLGSKLIFESSAEQLCVSDGTLAGTQVLSTTSYPQNLQADGGVVYFSFSGVGGLFATDGTVAGTHQVSTETGQTLALTAAGSLVYYVTQPTPGAPNQLWSYDTTKGTTTLVGNYGTGNYVGAPIVAGGVAYFADSNGSLTSNTLYAATAAGGETQMNPGGQVVKATYLTAAGSKLFFAGYDAGSNVALYVTDGTAAGTTKLATLQNFTSNGYGLIAIGNKVYFENTDAVNGTEMWASDGTVAGTHAVTNTATANPGSAHASGYVSVGSTTYFTATDGLHGQELWTFTGTGSATMVADINAGAGDSNPTQLTAFGGALYFAASGADGVAELWKTTGSGATQITTAANGAHVQALTAVGTRLFFFGSDSVHGSGLFVSDGTAAGTTFLKSLSQAQAFYAVGSELYFNGADAASGGLQLWKSDGTAAGTVDVTGVPTSHLADNFNGAGKSDVLIQNTAGAVVVGEKSNGGESYTQVGALGAEWSFHGAGDFLGEGHSQFLIQNTAGQVDVGDVRSGHATYTQVAALGSEWKFVGTGDYLADGKSDFLIENSGGLVEVGEVGASGKAAYTQVGALGSEWKFVGSGDFLGEGHGQFLIENANGLVEVGDVRSGHATYIQVTALGSEWKFVGAGDFLGDGKTDFLIENSSGLVAIGEVGASGKASFTTIGALGPEWKFVGAGDYLGLGHDQFLIQNAAGAFEAANVVGGKAQYTQLGALGSEWSFHG